MAQIQILVNRLGILQLDRTAFLQQHLFPSVAVLPSAARDAAFLGLLGSLPELQRSDLALVEGLRQVWQADLSSL